MPKRVKLTWTATGHGEMVASRDRGPFQYEAYVPDLVALSQPQLPPDAGARIERAATACVQLDASPGVDDLEPVARLLLRAESVASSRIEGLRLSHRRIEEARFAPGGANGTALSIVRNIEAMARAIELGMQPEPLSLEGVLSIHRMLMYAEADRPIAGVLREGQSWIGGGNTPRRADFVPPPPEFVPELMEDFIAFVNRDDLPAVTQAAIAHAQFETIHPFADGNGRTGRCLIHLILRRRGLSQRIVPPVSVVLAANATKYIEGLTAFRELDLATWCGTFADALTIAGERALELGEDIRGLKAEWIERAGRPNKGSASRRLIDGLVGHPVVSVESARQILNVSDEAARLALSRLEKAEVLRQVTLGKRNRAWAAREVFELLDDFDASVRTG